MLLNCLGQKKKKIEVILSRKLEFTVLRLCVPFLQSEVQFNVYLLLVWPKGCAMRRRVQAKKNVSNEDWSAGQAPLALAGMPVHVPLQCPCCSRLPRLIFSVLGEKCNSFAITRQLLSHFWLSVSLKLVLHVKGRRRKAACTEKRDPC